MLGTYAAYTTLMYMYAFRPIPHPSHFKEHLCWTVTQAELLSQVELPTAVVVKTYICRGLLISTLGKSTSTKNVPTPRKIIGNHYSIKGQTSQKPENTKFHKWGCQGWYIISFSKNIMGVGVVSGAAQDTV